MAILNASAGPMPWNGDIPSFKRQKQRADRGSSKYPGYQFSVGTATRHYKTGDQQYQTGGWTVIQPDQYTKNPTKPEMVEMRLFNGRKSYVPIGDVEQFIGYRRPTSGQNITDAMAEYVNQAFDKTSGQGKYYVEEAAAGHIKEIRYNPTFQIMDVGFRKRGNQGADTSVVFFRVPMQYWIEFQRYAISMATMPGFDGSERHLLGIRFWDLIRIRGQREGSRFEYTYESGMSLSGGSEQGKYSEMVMRQMAPQAQQPIEASTEATVTNKEEPSPVEAAEIENEQAKSELKGQKYTAKQKENIAKYLDRVEEKFGVSSKQATEMRLAIMKDILSVLGVAAKYKLW